MEIKEIDKIFDTLYKIWIKFNIGNNENIRGIPEFEYKKLEDLYKNIFPYTFSVYLKKYTSESLNEIFWIFNSYIGIIEAQNVADKLLKSYNKNLPDNSFVFGYNCECKFFYFVDNNTNNPEIYMCSEQNCEHNQNEYELVNYKMGKFTDWIINQTIGKLIMCENNAQEIQDTKKMLEKIRESTNGT